MQIYPIVTPVFCEGQGALACLHVMKKLLEEQCDFSDYSWAVMTYFDKLYDIDKFWGGHDL